MISVCTDSNAQLPSEALAGTGLGVVPLTIVLNGESRLEAPEDLDPDEFWAAMTRPGPAPSVSTAAPSPGELLAAWTRLIEAGATEIVSVHVGSDISGTVASAQVAAPLCQVPVHVVDSGTASFALGLATLAAMEAARAGRSPEEVRDHALRVARATANVFVVGTLAAARAGGRLAEDAESKASALTILSLVGPAMEVVGEAAHPEHAAEVMALHVLADDRPMRVGIGASDQSSFSVADRLERLLVRSGAPLEVLRYRVGPSVGAHTGPGTAGAVFHPLDQQVSAMSTSSVPTPR